MQRTIVMAVGAGIGILWIGLAAVSLVSAARGLANGRSDWALGWGLVGILLAAAGAASVIGTWWHQYRVLRDDQPPPGP